MDSRFAVRTLDTPIGPMTAGAIEGSEPALCMLEFGHRTERAKEFLETAFGAEPVSCEVSPILDQTESELAEYFAGTRRRFTMPLNAPGTTFQEAVWAELRRIPYGKTTSYSELARRIGHPGAQRAVGAANGANRIAIIIPCHRVIDAAGRLHGYGGGLDRKRWLLELEGARAPMLFQPAR